MLAAGAEPGVYRLDPTPNTHAYRVVDAGTAVVCLVLILIVMNPQETAWGFRTFLETRISVKNVLIGSSAALTWPLVFAVFGLYRFDELSTVWIEFGRVAKACAICSIFAVVAALSSASGAFGMGSVLVFWIAVIAATMCVRAMLRGGSVLTQRLRTSPRCVVIVGTGSRAVEFQERLMRASSCSVLGFVDTVSEALRLPAGGPPFLGTIDALEQILASHPVDTVHIALPVKSCYGAIAHAVSICERVGVEASYNADIFAPSRSRPVVHDTSLMVSRKVVTDDFRLLIKRATDIVGAIIGLIMFAPAMIAAAILIRLTSPGPVLFVQERVGFNRRHFKMYKLRTMVSDATELQPALEAMNEKDGPVFKIIDDPRVTSVGRVLRSLSIDEMPQLWNVLKGEMSLVGPRPLPLRDVSRFPTASLMRRFSVKPGLTGLWQISGRSETNFDRWIELDLEYIDRWSLTLDMEILARTIPAVLLGVGAV